MIKGKTSSGFEFEIEKERLDNYELLEAISEVETNPLAITKTVDLLLGIEQKEKLKDHLRTENGFVSTEKISNEITEIFESQNETKNS